jgi:hypothetical protein
MAAESEARPPPRTPFAFLLEVLRRSLRAWTGALPWLLVPALLLALPTLPFDFDDFRARLAAGGATIEPRHAWTPIAHLLALLLLQGAAATIVFPRLRGEPLALATVLRDVGRSALRIAAAGAIIAVLALLFAMPGVVLGAAHPALWPLRLLGLWPILVFLLAPPIVAVERTDALGALRRSAFLTAGARPLVALLVLLTALAGVVLVGLVAMTMVVTSNVLLQFNLVLLAQLLSDTLTAVVGAVLYGELRRAKEGIDLTRERPPA